MCDLARFFIASSVSLMEICARRLILSLLPDYCHFYRVLDHTRKNADVSKMMGNYLYFHREDA